MLLTKSQMIKQQPKIQTSKQPTRATHSKRMKDRKQTQMSSLSSLTHSHENTQATKKSISTQEISIESTHSNLQKITPHHNIIVPFEINIRSLIKHLLMKLQEQGIIILYSDENQGEILIQKKINKNCFTSFLDCLCLCKKQGWPQGSITQNFQAISILIKRQYVQYRCSVKVRTNCPREKSSPQLLKFVQETLQFIKKCVQPFRDSHEEQKVMQINQSSPLALQISANEKAYELFVSNNIQDKRFKTLFKTSLNKIQHSIQLLKKQYYLGSESQPNQERKKDGQEEKSGSIKKSNSKKKMRISETMQLLISETSNIFEFCRQLNIVHAPDFHPEYAFYAIEGLFCYNIFPELFELYKHDLVQHCESFHKNSQYINKNLTSKQYFDYLQVRPKFRLQNSYQPYDLAINALRQLETSLTLRQILFCIQKTFSLIKVCCLYEHDGKLDISSMDDILPVMIYVVAKAQVIDFPVYVKIIDDYVKIKGIFELEERVVTTLYVATEDISKKLPHLNKQ